MPANERVRILRVHRQAGAAGLLVDEEHALPVLAAVGRAIDAALLLRPGGAAERAREHDVGIVGMNDDAADAPCLRQAHVRPCLACVRGLVDAVAHHIDVADRPCLAGSRPDRRWLRRRYGERANRGRRLFIEDRVPTIAAIRRLPHAARRGARVIGARVAWNAGDRRYAIAYTRADKAKAELTVIVAGAGLLRDG